MSSYQNDCIQMIVGGLVGAVSIAFIMACIMTVWFRWEIPKDATREEEDQYREAIMAWLYEETAIRIVHKFVVAVVAVGFLVGAIIAA